MKIKISMLSSLADLFGCLLMLALVATPPVNAAEIAGLSAAGESAFQKGAFQEAAGHWEQALAASRSAGDTGAAVRVSISLSGAYQALGLHRRAVALLEQALRSAETGGSVDDINIAKARLGGALIMVQEPERAATLLDEALTAAEEARNERLAGAIFNDLGNLFSVQEKYVEALTAYEASVARARDAGDQGGVAQALVNTAGAALTAGETARAEDWNAQAREAVDRLADGHAKAFLWLSIAQIDMGLPPGEPEARAQLRLRANDVTRRALTLAGQLGDRAIETYSLGYLAQLYAEDGQEDAALDLARRALFVAQQAQMPEAQYRWEWQVGRLLRARGENAAAIAAYRSAVQTMSPVRNDVSLGYGNTLGKHSFRESEGPLFFELADMLLEEARATADSARQQTLLLEARDTVELLKAVELEDYFCDDCVDVQRAQTRTVEAVDERTAVVYLIPLPRRTEILIGLAGGLRQVEVPVGADELQQVVNQFRRNLETRTTNRYLLEARQLYDWLIRPIRGLLQQNEVDTLVFVPDGALRTIPFAALSDRETKRFLIEDLAVAVVPGLSLVAPSAIKREEVRLLLNGLSEPVQGFAELKFVAGELEELHELYPSEMLFNTSFTLEGIKARLAEEQYSIIHIASHGQFDKDVRKTFVLTYDTKLTLDQLEALIRPSQYRGRPVELLVLSACQTAAGDDRAALGLAGVAVKAGARSALATLWFVNDQSTSELVTAVYRELKDDPALSKAQALQAAQVKLLNEPRFRHPCYWSPYLIIGNWL